MFVPIVPHCTVVNKNIVYADTVLPLNSSGNSICVSSIEDVSEAELESCLKSIFVANPNVIFNTIQYSREKEKVTFYTDSTVNVESFKQERERLLSPILSKKDILEELKVVLTLEDNKDSNCISLYDVGALTRQKEKKYDYIKKEKFSNDFFFYDFDYNKCLLKIGYRFFDDYKVISFSKSKDGDLYVVSDFLSYGKDLLVKYGEELSQKYDDFMELRTFKTEHEYFVRTVNSRFLASISSYGVDIQDTAKEFKLAIPTFKEEYSYDCNSSKVIEAFKGKEDLVFKHIMVRIDDCPENLQEELREIRKKQLSKQEHMSLIKRLFGRK